MSEHTIAENLIRLQNSATAISNAIVAKGGTVASGDGLEEFAADIGTIPSGGGTTSDVNFYDYDGTVVYSYTAAEFAELTSMPANPTHEGLTSKGWNWSLVDAKTYVATYGKLEIGQQYTSSDGKTRIYIHLDEYTLKPYLGLGINGSVDVDWGDGSAHSTMTGSDTTVIVYELHEYAAPGDYIITLTIDSTSYVVFGQRNNRSAILNPDTSNTVNTKYLSTIDKIIMGDRIKIGEYAFLSCLSLSQIILPEDSITIPTHAFYNCSLHHITIPSSVTSIGERAFYGCNVLSQISLNMYLESIGNNAFEGCYQLRQITIPSAVTSIGAYAFRSCYQLRQITIPSAVTSIGERAFYACPQLRQITIPSSVTSLGAYAFHSCYQLIQITIPSSITSIGQYTFNSCYQLIQITIPSAVTSIGAYAFYACQSLSYIKFESSSPATVSNANAWTGLPSFCIIYIPLDSYTSYTTASNYPSPSSYKYVEYATYSNGESLPSTSQSGTRSYVWYATIDDWLAQTNPISVGNGKEIYCRSAAI